MIYLLHLIFNCTFLLSNEIDCLCLLEIGSACHNLGENDRAFNYHQKLLSLAIKINNQAAICQAYGGIGNSYFRQSKLKIAIKYFHKQLKLSRKINLITEECQALDGLVHCYRLTGRMKKSFFYLTKASLKPTFR